MTATSKRAPGYYVQVNEKGQPVADENGAQKLIVVDDNGNVAKVTPDGELKVAISGEINVGDVTLDGVTIKDADGNQAKVTEDGAQLMQLAGSIVEDNALQTRVRNKSVTTTVLNAASVAAGGNTGDINMGLDGTESEVWVGVAIDKQPWSLSGTHRFWNSTANGDSFFPKRTNVGTAQGNAAFPFLSLFTNGLLASYNLTEPTNMEEARGLVLGYSPNGKVKVINSSSVIATVTVYILRVWR